MMPPGPLPPMEWLEAANRLETVAHQLSSVVHEVNNMLQIVSGSAEMLAMTADAPPAVLRRADVIGTQVHRAAALLTDVLAFSREAPEVERVELREIVGRALAMRRYAMAKARIDEHVDLCAEDVMVRASPRRLLQIVLNLSMRGERVLAGQRGARLSVTVFCDNGRALVSVEENSGEAPVDLQAPLAFDPPLGDMLSPAHLDIGLHVAAWLAEQEGGQLSVVSGPDRGSVATLSLPVL